MSPSPGHPPSTRAKKLPATIRQQSGGAAAARAQLHADFKRREREAEGELRFQLYQQAMQLIAGGASQHEAARTIGVGPTTLIRWRQRIARGESLASRSIQGRPAIAARFTPLLTTAHRAEIARLVIACASVSGAWQRFAHQPQCPAALGIFLRGRKTVPGSLLALVPASRRKAVVIECGNITAITKGAA